MRYVSRSPIDPDQLPTLLKPTVFPFTCLPSTVSVDSLSDIVISSTQTPTSRSSPPPYTDPPKPSHFPLSRDKCLSTQPGLSSQDLRPSCYQQGTRVLGACGDGESSPPSPHIDRRKPRPHLCGRGTTVSHHQTTPPHTVTTAGGSRWTSTVAAVAAARRVAVPELPVVVVPPALDGRVVLR